MEFHGDALDGHHHVVEALFLHLAHVIGKSLGKLANLLPAGIHPDIDITRRTSGRIGIQHCIPLPLQDATLIPLRDYLMIDRRGGLV